MMKPFQTRDGVTAGVAKSKPERLGFGGTLILHSQFILLAALVLGAVALKVAAR
ncbi:MAG: hypothetical protein ACYC41_11975 [Bacillota bacterium]